MANQQMINSTSSAAALVMPPPPPPPPPKKYDVFLSFRGEDTRGNFTSYLHEALIQKKVETYIDYRLEKGDEISSALITAIEESRVSVVIFSENYAFSKWCLDEISVIMECNKYRGQVVIPVFYKIDPSHVRKQKGSYEEAFAKHHDQRDLMNKLHKWRDALTQAANLAGWDSLTYRTESEFIKDIVDDILHKLNLMYPIELKGVVGIEENYVGVESLLELGSREVRMIGIWGMGGIGKTTLAIALHAKLSSQFEGHCYLSNIKEQTEKHGLDALRNKLLSKLLEEDNLHVDVPKIESHFVSSRLRRKKVFIVLDDVATSEQLEDLISDYNNCLGPGSRVIVTTRDKHIFNHVDGIYEVKELNKNDSLHFFCLNAFREKRPENGYQELSESVIAYCKGNPLALKVLGARLRSRSNEAWRSELRKLQKIPDVKIDSVLRLSYDDLDRAEKDIFLDIACFFKGESKDNVTSLLEACDFFAGVGIEVLIDKSLVTISGTGTIEMHDLIQEMGWNIVHQESAKEPERRSRLWDPEEVYDVLKYNKGTEAVEGIILDASKIQDLHLSFNSFAKMKNMRFLKFYYGKWRGSNIYLPNGLDSLSDKLRYLQWQGYCLATLPSTFSAKLLVELSMPNSNLEKLWDGVQNLVNLKEIDLRFSKNLVELPDLSTATKLKVLTLTQCESLRHVPPSILSLDELQYLDLDGCTEIESLETENHLKSLCHLRLSNCSSLKEFSVSSEKLEMLWLDGTIIQELPPSIWSCEKLKLIHLQGCDNLIGFGDKLSIDDDDDDWGIGSLKTLDLSECKQLQASNLCFSHGALRSLTLLKLDNCCNLQTLPDSIAYLSSLQHITLCGSNVESLSPKIKNLSKLRELWLDNCRRLMSLPAALPSSLLVLSAVNCTSLEITNLTQLDLPFEPTPGHLNRHQSVFVPGTRFPERFGFRAEGASVTISHLPLSGLCGFIFCLALTRSGPNCKYRYVECIMHQRHGSVDCLMFYLHSKKIGSKRTFLSNLNLVSDHVFLWYVDIKEGGDISLPRARRIQKSGVYDNPYDISFEFSLRKEEGGVRSTKGIKGCRVCPMYASQQKGPELLELEPNRSQDIDESQRVTVGFEINEGSSHSNEDDHTKKLLQVMHHQTVTTARGCERKPQSFKEENCCTSSIPENQDSLMEESTSPSSDSTPTAEFVKVAKTTSSKKGISEECISKRSPSVEDIASSSIEKGSPDKQIWKIPDNPSQTNASPIASSPIQDVPETYHVQTVEHSSPVDVDMVQPPLQTEFFLQTSPRNDNILVEEQILAPQLASTANLVSQDTNTEKGDTVVDELIDLLSGSSNRASSLSARSSTLHGDDFNDKITELFEELKGFFKYSFDNIYLDEGIRGKLTHVVKEIHKYHKRLPPLRRGLFNVVYEFVEELTPKLPELDNGILPFQQADKEKHNLLDKLKNIKSKKAALVNKDAPNQTKKLELEQTITHLESELANAKAQLQEVTTSSASNSEEMNLLDQELHTSAAEAKSIVSKLESLEVNYVNVVAVKEGLVNAWEEIKRTPF